MYIKKAYRSTVESFEHDQDGWWIYMVPGVYIEHEGLHTIHEDTQKEALEALYTYPLGRCRCEDCRREMKRWGTTEETVNRIVEGIKSRRDKEMKVQITKCYLVQIVDKDGYEIMAEYVFGNHEKAEAVGKEMKREIMQGGMDYE